MVNLWFSSRRFWLTHTRWPVEKHWTLTGPNQMSGKMLSEEVSAGNPTLCENWDFLRDKLKASSTGAAWRKPHVESQQMQVRKEPEPVISHSVSVMRAYELPNCVNKGTWPLSFLCHKHQVGKPVDSETRQPWGRIRAPIHLVGCWACHSPSLSLSCLICKTGIDISSGLHP